MEGKDFHCPVLFFFLLLRRQYRQWVFRTRSTALDGELKIVVENKKKIIDDQPSVMSERESN